MKTLNANQLIEKITAIKGTAIVGILALTDAKALKTGNPFGEIFKQVRAVAFVGANYEKSANREAGRQDAVGEFIAEKLPWGLWLAANKIISHKGEFYLRTQSSPGQRRKQAARVLCYRDASGKFLSPEDIKPFLPESRESAKQQRVGLEETIWVRNYKFSSIQKIRINGETFKMI